MKKMFSALIATALLGASLGAWAEKLKFGYSDVESEIYQLGNSTQVANPPGATIDLLNLVAKDLGIEIEYVRTPVKRNLESLEKGEIDGAFMYSFKDDRLAFGHFPMKDGKPNPAMRVTSLSYVYYKMKGSPFTFDGKNVGGLGTSAIGYNAAYSIGDELKKLGLRVEEAKTTEQNFKKLQEGRIAAYAMQDHTGDQFIAEHKLANIEKVSPPIESKPYYLMLSKQFVAKNPALAEKLWSRLGKLRDEKMKDILKKYM